MLMTLGSIFPYTSSLIPSLTASLAPVCVNGSLCVRNQMRMIDTYAIKFPSWLFGRMQL